MILCFGKKNIFLTSQDPSLGRPDSKNFILSETAKNKFAALFEWFYMIFCFKNKIFFVHMANTGPIRRSKIFCIFWRFEFSKGKIWVFSGVLIFHFFCQPRESRGRSVLWSISQNKKIRINMIRVVLMFFFSLFRKKYFFGLEPPLGDPNPNKLFS